MMPRFRPVLLAMALMIAGLPIAGASMAMAEDNPAGVPAPAASPPPPASPASKPDTSSPPAPAASRDLTPTAAAPAVAASPLAPPAMAGGGIGGAALPHDLSPWTMFLNADIVVKAVMVGLALASVFTWTVWVAKGATLVAATSRARRAVAALMRAEGLGAPDLADDLPWRRSRPVAAMVDSARQEVERSASLPAEGIKERAAIALQRIEARAARAMTRGTGFVATIGSTAPFVGLFGTVWGIMNSFVGISQAHTSSLAVVAPGIAEALLATAIGLVAAIPAVVIYNSFARAIAAYRALLGDASAEVLRHLSLDLDRRGYRALRAAE